MKTAAVIATAGRSENSLGFIPILCLNSCTVIKGIVNTLYAAGVDHICVITGYKAEVIENELKGTGVSIVRNRHYERTDMLNSVKLGLNYIRGSFDRILITPGDIPLVHRDTIRKMVCTDCGAVRPIYEHEYGHPLVVSAETAEAILRHDGNEGLDVLLERITKVTDLPVNDKGVIMEIDSKRDLIEMKAKELSEMGGGKLRPDIQINIAKGSTVLSSQLFTFLYMIDITGSIQKACRSLNISYTKGWKLLNETEESLGCELIKRRPGGEQGGGSSLTRKGRQLLTAYSGFSRMVSSYSENIFNYYFKNHKDK